MKKRKRISLIQMSIQVEFLWLTLSNETFWENFVQKLYKRFKPKHPPKKNNKKPSSDYRSKRECRSAREHKYHSKIS